jgi:hypothetical protein
MENPDVVLEVSETDGKMTLSYKVYNRREDDSASACDFVEMIKSMCGNCEEE